MTTKTILLFAYIVCVVAWIIYVSIQIAKKKEKDKTERIIFLITIPFAPICWIAGLIIKISDHITRNRPKPLPKNIRRFLKKDLVSYHGKTMSIREVNRITGKNYTLEQVYGKKYVAALDEKEKEDFEEAKHRLTIDDKVREDDPAFAPIRSFAEARMEGKMEPVRSLFAPEVSLTLWGHKTIHGIDDVLAYWEDRHRRFTNDQIKIDYRIIPCMYYNGIAFQESPEGYSRMIVLFRFKEGKIVQILFSPRFLNAEYEYYGGYREAPFTEEFFRRYLTDELEAKENRVPCLSCGESSENLNWYSFDHYDYGPFDGFRGEVSVCPHCHRTVEIKPDERYERSEESRKEHPKRFFEESEKFSVPGLYYAGFEYSTPLEGTAYLDAMDDELLIEPDEFQKSYLHGDEADPRTTRQCAAEFHHIFFRTMKEKHPECFDAILDCYRKAYEDGLTEAGNNLGILYINYADRVEEGEAIIKECAEKGCGNAIANHFAILWGTHQDYEAATQFALSAPAPTIPVLWNLAILHLLGPDIKGNPLPVDTQKAKHCLEQILDGTAPRFDDLCKRYEKAQVLLPRVDEFNALTLTGWNFVGSGVEAIINSINSRYTDVQSILKKYLPHIHVPEGMTLDLSPASEEHNDHGDISRFVLLRGKEFVAAGDEELLPHLIVEKSEAGAWEAYLFSLARHLLPTFWHGGYNAREIIFGKEELRRVPSQEGRALDVILRGQPVTPSVRFDGDTALVECCYWSEWGGLYREKVSITFDGDRIAEFKDTGAENIYSYDCGIMF